MCVRRGRAPTVPEGTLLEVVGVLHLRQSVETHVQGLELRADPSPVPIHTPVGSEWTGG